MILPHTQFIKSTHRHKGKVIIAAAGPGDPDLITVKTAEALQIADVILTDRLVSEVILHRYASPLAEIIYVGKECRKKNSTPQEQINDLLVKYAFQGKTVVRLKGGDVSIFSNILDELQALITNNIPYEIIPGVTAALGAAAYAGIPLTARGHATAVRLLTYYKAEIITDAYWKELSATDDTLVFYMSVATIDEIILNLIEHHISAEVYVAVVEQATTCFQNVHTCNIYYYEKELKGKNFASPSLVIIGKVAALHSQFKWLENSGKEDKYFTPAGISISELNKPVKHVG